MSSSRELPMTIMTGSRYLAETFHAYGVTHVFLMPVCAPRALMEMERLGIKRIIAHSEKSAAYMADGYARVKRSTGICMAQSVGAVNLAAGLQDAFLACSPVIALTGRQTTAQLHRHAYQEVDHIAPFSAVTKYNVHVSKPDQLPVFLRQAFRESVSFQSHHSIISNKSLVSESIQYSPESRSFIWQEP